MNNTELDNMMHHICERYFVTATMHDTTENKKSSYNSRAHLFLNRFGVNCFGFGYGNTYVSAMGEASLETISELLEEAEDLFIEFGTLFGDKYCNIYPPPSWAIIEEKREYYKPASEVFG